MKIVLMPRTKPGTVSVALFLTSVLLVCYFFLMVNVFDQRGGDTFFSNLNLTIPMLLAWACSAASLGFGIVEIVKSDKLSILIMTIVLITFLVTLYGIAEIAFPH